MARTRLAFYLGPPGLVCSATYQTYVTWRPTTSILSSSASFFLSYNQSICVFTLFCLSQVRDVASVDKEPPSIPEQLDKGSFSKGQLLPNYEQQRVALIEYFQAFLMAPANTRKSSSALPEGMCAPFHSSGKPDSFGTAYTRFRISRGQVEGRNATVRRLPPSITSSHS